MQKLSLKKVVETLKNNKKPAMIAGGILLLTLATAITLTISNVGKDKKTDYKPAPPAKKYTLTSAKVSCRTVQALPESKATTEVCTNKVTLEDKESKQSKEYDTTSFPYLYKSGQQQPIAQLNDLAKNKQVVTVQFGGKDNSQIRSISY